MHRSRWLYLLLILIAGLAAWSFTMDRQTIAFFAAHATPVNKTIASRVSEFCDWPWLAGAGVISLAIAVRLGSARAIRILLIMLLASSLAGIISNGVKGVTGRARPNLKNVEPGWYGIKKEGEWIIGKNKYSSFPSSHTACAAGFFLPLALAGVWPGIVGILVTALVAWARMQLGVHHLSDVLCGLLVGLASILPFLRTPCRIQRLAEQLRDRFSPATHKSEATR